MTKQKIFVEIVCLFVMILFVYTGLSKFLDFYEFRAAVGKSPMLTNFTVIIAYVIPSIEIIISALIIVPKWRLHGLLWAYSLMLMFTLYIYLMVYHSEYRGCTCGGIIQRMSWNDHLYFNAVVTVLILFAIIMEKSNGMKISERQQLIA